MTKSYWLMKSEPGTFSFEDLRRSPKKRTCWEGVRNYQARNFLRDEVKRGDGVLFYHSRVEPMAVMGIAEVVRGGYPDSFQFDPKSRYYDEKAKVDDPRWFMVDIQYVHAFDSPVTLVQIKATRSLADMLLVNNSRLSVQPVAVKHWRAICKMGGVAP